MPPAVTLVSSPCASTRVHSESHVGLEQVNNIGVLVRATTKNSIEEYGDPAKFLEDNQYLLGKQTFLGEFCSLVVRVTVAHA